MTKAELCKEWRGELNKAKSWLVDFDDAFDKSEQIGKFVDGFEQIRSRLYRRMDYDGDGILESWQATLRSTSGQRYMTIKNTEVYASFAESVEIDGYVFRIGDEMRAAKGLRMKYNNKEYEPAKMRIKIVGFRVHTKELIVEARGRITKIHYTIDEDGLSSYKVGPERDFGLL
ncbi:hypothetical protein HON36_03800 [Candidatus Parcubacteria bacterium]|jgi:hypothetical protein|nr:hypothetical protein [Candidatus Parcubacteria bacterium]MBT7228047.1 hypothetical protein [Candidatus Parcubacteria bacterium]